MNAVRAGSPDGADVVAAVELIAAALAPAAADPAAWDGPAGRLRWTCRDALAHIVDCEFWYAGLLARCAAGEVTVPEVARDGDIPALLDAARSGGAVLGAVVRAASDEDRAWHPFGVGDRSGFAGMGCDEALVHGWDIATGLGLTLSPPAELCERVLRRLFPWAPAEGDPWELLLWVNGRQPLGDEPPRRRWKFHCAPLVEWDGRAPDDAG